MHKYIDIRDVITYVSCPYKLALAKSFKISELDLVKRILLRCYTRCTSLMGTGKVSTLTAQQLLGWAWSEEPEESRSASLKDKLELSRRTARMVVDFQELYESGFEVVSVNNTHTLRVGGATIFNDLTSVFYNQEKNSVLVWGYQTTRSDITGNPKDFRLQLLSNSLYYAVLSDFESIDASIDVKIISLGTGRSYKPVIKSLDEVKTYINAIATAMDDHQYPRPIMNECRVCEYKDRCSWSVTGQGT
jgi:hypothetical protein